MHVCNQLWQIFHQECHETKLLFVLITSDADFVPTIQSYSHRRSVRKRNGLLSLHGGHFNFLFSVPRTRRPLLATPRNWHPRGTHHLRVHAPSRADGTLLLSLTDTATIRIRTPGDFSFFCPAEHFIYTINRPIGTFRGETTRYTPLRAAALVERDMLLSRPAAGPFILSGGNSLVHISRPPPGVYFDPPDYKRHLYTTSTPEPLELSLRPANYPRVPMLNSRRPTA